MIDEFESIRKEAALTVLAHYKLAAAPVKPGFVQTLTNGIRGWGGQVADAAAKANAHGGAAMRNAERQGAGTIGQAARGAYVTGRNFLRSEPGQQAAMAGVAGLGALGAGAYGAHQMAGGQPQQQPPPNPYYPQR